MSRKSRSRSTSPAGLVCPDCARAPTADERFCSGCGMPLVLGAGSEDVTSAAGAARERARKIAPAYARGELVRVAGGRNQAEAELIQNLLLEEGVPSLLRRSAGFDVPDFLAAGPRDVLVPESGAEAARDLLVEAELAPGPPAGSPEGPAAEADGAEPGRGTVGEGRRAAGERRRAAGEGRRAAGEGRRAAGSQATAHALWLLAAIVLAALVAALLAWALVRTGGERSGARPAPTASRTP